MSSQMETARLIIRSLQEDDLLIRSDKYDHQSSHLLDALLEFIDLTRAQVTEREEPKAFSDEVREQLSEFGDVTKVAIVLRLLLQDIGH